MFRPSFRLSQRLRRLVPEMAHDLDVERREVLHQFRAFVELGTSLLFFSLARMREGLHEQDVHAVPLPAAQVLRGGGSQGQRPLGGGE
jgi:hypothetical protein